MAESTLSSEGMLIIPKPVLDHLHLRPGDRIDFIIQSDGDVKVQPVGKNVTELKGLLRRPSKPISVDEMNQAIRTRAGNQS
jgi:antitoxin PrlF